MSVFIGQEARLAWLLGNPVQHSLSPAIHNLAYRKMGLNIMYMAMDVPKEQVKDAIMGLAALSAVGCNVTAPYKEMVYEILKDRVTPWGRALRAVNSICFEGNAVESAGNTDSYGFLKAWDEEIGESLQGRDCIIFGAGGAARAIIAALLCRGVRSIHIVNRGQQRAETLINELVPSLEHIGRHWEDPEVFGQRPAIFKHMMLSPFDSKIVPLVHLEKRFAYSRHLNSIPDRAVLVQATPLGMGCHLNESPCSFQELPFGTVACEAVYNPPETMFLRQTRALGAKTMSGLGLLVNQAVASIYAWTGLQAPGAAMRRLAENLLNGQPEA